MVSTTHTTRTRTGHTRPARAPRGKGEARSTVERAGRLLIALGEGRPSEGSTLTQLAQASGIHKSTALRLLASLERTGLVEHGADGSYRLGVRLIELASAFLDDLDLVRQAHGVLEELASSTQETVHLGVLTGTEVVYVDKVESPQSLRMVSRIGSRNPAYSTSLGKAILAYADERLLEAVAAAGLASRTPNTLTTMKALRSDLQATRTRGYSIDNEENAAGIHCVGAAVRDRLGRIVGAISVSGPTVRVNAETEGALGEAVRRAADEISWRLGHRTVVSG